MTDKPKELALLLYQEHKDSYFHIKAYPVWVTVGDNVPSNTSSYDHPGLSELYVLSQGSDHDKTRHIYAWEVEYRDTWSVDLRRARAMAHTLAMIERKLSQARDLTGDPSRFSDYLLRVSRALGIKAYLVEEKHTGCSYSDNTYRRLSAGDAKSTVDWWENSWLEEGKGKAA